jgi:glutaconate CoA-transferase subunit B
MYRAAKLGTLREVLGCVLQRGLVDVGFLGGAQIDRYGNLNSTVIGDYDHPAVRLPGAGGAPEIASSAGEVIVMLRQSQRSFVPALDFVSSVGFGVGGDRPRAHRGRGPSVVITDLGVLKPEPGNHNELRLTALHPGVTLDHVKESTGWPLRVSDPLATTDPPTSDELAILRDLKARTAAAQG